MDQDSSSALADAADSITAWSTGPGLIGVEVGAILFLLACSALFSGSEVALFSLSTAARERLEEGTDSGSKRVMKLLAQPRRLLVTILILNNFVNVGAAVITAVLTLQLTAMLNASPTIMFVAEVIVLTFLMLVLSEITPKLLASRNAIGFSKFASRILLPLYHLLRPIASLLAGYTEAFHGKLKPALRKISSEELKAMAEISEAHGTIEESERELIHSIVEFGETAVKEIMVSRLDMVALSVDSSIQDAIQTIRESGHTRLPLYQEHLDKIVGVIHSLDLLPYLSNTNGSGPFDWSRLQREALFVPAGKKLDDLLREFQERKTLIAIVVDEYGGTAGLVTLEDVLEEIVGDMRDENDDAEQGLHEPLGDGSYRCSGGLDLDDLNELFATQLTTDKFEFETLGGLVLHLSGSIPEPGDVFLTDNLRLEVEAVERNRIITVLVRRRNADR